MKYFTFFFLYQVFKSGVYFIVTHTSVQSSCIEMLNMLVAVVLHSVCYTYMSPHLMDTLVYDLLDHQTKYSLFPIHLLLKPLHLDLWSHLFIFERWKEILIYFFVPF